VESGEWRQQVWREPLLLEYPDRRPEPYASIEPAAVEASMEKPVPPPLKRRGKPNIPGLSEPEIIRHYTRLSSMSYGVDQGPVPLGSCTMKYNPRIAFKHVFTGRLRRVHPLQPDETVQGLLEMLYQLQEWLAHILGMDTCILHPAAGAHGELAGVLTIRKYHELAGQLSVKREIIVPDSAHGTNPASASMAGFRVVEVPTGPDGNVDMEALRSAVGESTAGLMLTNPSTLGLFEERIEEIAGLVHKVGGLLYYDGANLNGIMGYARPGDMGFDIAHVNVHKTFSSPHGGGGPGAGPVCFKDVEVPGTGLRLSDIAPGARVVYDEREGLYRVRWNTRGVGRIRMWAFNTLPLVWAYIYILSLGSVGLRRATERAVINTNYFLSLVRGIEGYTLPYAPGRPRKHEAVLSAKPLERETGVNAEDVAKGLLDRGFYAPTIYFPLIVDEALMVEFTETETPENIQAYVRALEEIAAEARASPEKAKSRPLNTSVGRVDQVYANRPRTLTPSWRVYLRRAREGGG